MKVRNKVGRLVGVLILLHLVVGLFVPFLIVDRIRRPAGLLAGAAANAGQLRVAILLFVIGSAFATAIAVTAWPLIRRYSSGMALWLLALGVASFILQMVDNGALLSLLSLSQEYARAEVAKAEVLESLGILANAIRKWAHLMYLLVAVSWILLLCATLFRFRLVPRLLSGLGLVGTMLQIYGVTLRAIFGYPMQMGLAMPLAPVYAAIGLWLIVKGFDEEHGNTENLSAATASPVTV